MTLNVELVSAVNGRPGVVGLLLALCLGLSACNSLSDLDCPATPEAVIVIEVLDSLTNEPAAQGATGVIRMGVFSAALIATSSSRMENQILEGGPWEITIAKTGYRDWVKPNVVVEVGRCGREPQQFVARLQRIVARQFVEISPDLVS